MKIDPPLFQPTGRALPTAPVDQASEARRAFAALLASARQTAPPAPAQPAQDTPRPTTISQDPQTPLQRPGRVLDIRV
jgi:hypothetical protein